MDFYYSTGTVKTVMDHPTTGANQLFRRCKVSPAKYIKILRDPRSHTSIGYRVRSQMPQEQEQEQVQVQEQKYDYMADADEMPIEIEIEKKSKDDRNESDVSTFFAKNEEYDFQTEGHTNRKAAMAKLQPAEEFKAWQEAARREWACVHAKFYVALVHKRENARKRDAPVRGRKRLPQRLEPLPEMTPVVDIKPSEKAILGTKFEPTGTGRMQSTSRNKVKMKRIHLNDAESSQSDPVFECKLYYRAQKVLDEEGENVSNISDSISDDGVVAYSPSSPRYSPTFSLGSYSPTPSFSSTTTSYLSSGSHYTSCKLEEYKVAKLGQVNGLHLEHESQDKREADLVLEDCREHIMVAQDTKSVDKVIQNYWNWHQKQLWQKHKPATQ
mmetsp:Transcript_21254/g.27148  ORF Transcript_21254/g.27148 Transcript_21254/m.27148 type:complete len:384 (+) Transcript_21254:324-1475(+)